MIKPPSSKAREKTCLVCGKVFVAGSNRAKYCQDCRAAVYKDIWRQSAKAHQERQKRKNPKSELDDLQTGSDSPEQIQACLNCTETHCPGYCKKTGGAI